MVSHRNINRRVAMGTGVALVAGATSYGYEALLQEDIQQPREQTGFALMELFTSQGCSSCPPADAILAQVAAIATKNALPVYTLSFHVDYWNYLGWRDPFSKPEFSARQRNYAAIWQSSRVYTPQMVVNGTQEFVGSNSELTKRTLKSSLRDAQKARLNISIDQQDHKWRLSWKATGAEARDALQVALVRKRAFRNVTAGENHGRELRHVNVVENFFTIKLESDRDSFDLALPQKIDTDKFHLVAFLQDQTKGTVRAATQQSLPS